MTQTNEELREKIHNLLGEHNIVFSQNFIDDLYAIIPQPEQITVMVKEHAFYTSPDTKIILYQIVCVGNFNIDFLDKFYSKQEALDWCKRFNLKVINEVSND